MPLFGQKNIEVSEYTNTSVITRRAGLLQVNNHNPLTFNGWRLSVAMARTLCNQHIGIPELYFDIMQSIFSLQFLINGANNNIRLNSNRLNRLRDFSRTNKVGEVAQAMTWLYLVEESNFPFVNDFELFCTNNGIIIPPNSSTPDFIAQDTNKTTNICIAESKGKLINSPATIKSKLKKGLNQCDVGELLVNTTGTHTVVKKLCFCSEFSREIDATNSQLHFVDPDKPVNNIDYSDYIFRAHYSNWFYLIGDFNNADKLLKGNNIEFNEKVFTKKEIQGEVYWVANFVDKVFSSFRYINSNIRPLILISDYLLSNKINIGISEKVVNSLKNKDIEKFDYIAPKSDKDIFFKDGTILTGMDNDYGE